MPGEGGTKSNHPAILFHRIELRVLTQDKTLFVTDAKRMNTIVERDYSTTKLKMDVKRTESKQLHGLYRVFVFNFERVCCSHDFRIYTLRGFIISDAF